VPTVAGRQRGTDCDRVLKRAHGNLF
jgi:hypothetical protein